MPFVDPSTWRRMRSAFASGLSGKLGAGVAGTAFATAGAVADRFKKKFARKAYSVPTTLTGTGESGWVKSSKKKRKPKSRKVKAKKASKRRTIKLIKRVIHGELPNGAISTITMAGQALSAFGLQGIIYQDGITPFYLGHLGQYMDAIAIAFNGKGAARNGPVVLGGDFDIDVPFVVKSSYAEGRFFNNTTCPIEVDMYICTAKIMQTTDAYGIWSTEYSNVNTITAGTPGAVTYNEVAGIGTQNMFAHPGEVPFAKTRWTYQKKTFRLLPGAQERVFVKGKTGTFLPSKYATSSSTVASPVLNYYIPGTKQVFFAFRNSLGTIVDSASSVFTGHVSPTNSANDLICWEWRTHITVEAPEETPVANRKDTVVHLNWSAPVGAGRTLTSSWMAEYNNPAGLTQV